MLGRCCCAALLASLTSCGSGSAGDAAAPAPLPTQATSTPTASPSPEAASGTRLVVMASGYGPMLFDATGQAIYLFDVEKTSEPKCYDVCAQAWPPVLTEGAPVAGRGVDGTQLGTTQRADGTRQVTYNDHPLYFYAHEGKREVKCHDVFLNGGNWYVVQPDGEPAPPG